MLMHIDDISNLFRGRELYTVCIRFPNDLQVYTGMHLEFETI